MSESVCEINIFYDFIFLVSSPNRVQLYFVPWVNRLEVVFYLKCLFITLHPSQILFYIHNDHNLEYGKGLKQGFQSVKLKENVALSIAHFFGEYVSLILKL